MTHNIEVEGGKTVRLSTAGKYCDRDILVTGVHASEILDYVNNKITSVGPYSFYKSPYRSISLPALTETTGGSVFTNCKNLARVELRNFKGGKTAHTFSGDSNLEFVDLGYATNLSAYTFNQCTELKIVVLRRATLVNLADMNAFTGCRLAMTIYVPSALIEEYTNATNWSLLESLGTVEFVALEGSEYE